MTLTTRSVSAPTRSALTPKVSGSPDIASATPTTRCTKQHGSIPFRHRGCKGAPCALSFGGAGRPECGGRRLDSGGFTSAGDTLF